MTYYIFPTGNKLIEKGQGVNAAR